MRKIAAAALTTIMFCTSALAMEVGDRLSLTGTV